MTAVYATALVVGVLLLLGWVAAVAVSATVPGWDHVDPDIRFGRTGRAVVAGFSGFGLGGMSSTFGGWPAFAALLGAVGGAGLVIAASQLLDGARGTEDT